MTKHTSTDYNHPRHDIHFTRHCPSLWTWGCAMAVVGLLLYLGWVAAVSLAGS